QEHAQWIVGEAPRGVDTGAIEEEIDDLDNVISALEDEVQELLNFALKERSEAARERLPAKEEELRAARDELRTLRLRWEAMTSIKVSRKLTAVVTALSRKPINVVEANKALKEAINKIVLDPGDGAYLTIYWHHAEDRPQELGPLRSPFGKTEDGYVFKP